MIPDETIEDDPRIEGSIDYYVWPPNPPRGGQHVGVGSSGALVVHRTSGISVVRTESRSLRTNRIEALDYLVALLALAEPGCLK